ncbi:MAG: PDZ domain-containing protein, partial [Bacteroidota bacterium]
VAALGTTSLIFGQTLNRKASLGIRPSLVDEVAAKKMKLEGGGGILIQQVFPNSTCEKLGVRANDVLLSINGNATTTMPELMAAIKPLRDQTPVSLNIWRDGKELTLSGKAVGRPMETSAHGEVLYGSVPFRGGRLRTIINRPKGEGSFPAIFFIPGYPCSSVDNLNPIHPYKQLIEGFAEEGFVVMRTEKAFVGDSEGKLDCNEIDFATENEGFLAAYKTFRDLEYVDPNQLFIFGHSMGCVSTPVLARQVVPKGVMVYGTVYEPWSEYLLKMLRYQKNLSGEEPLKVEQDMRDHAKLLYQHYTEKTTLSELEKDTTFARLLAADFQYDGNNHLFTRNASFWQGVHETNLTEAWQQTPSYVLSIYGEADFEVFDPESMKGIIRIVNHYHPGKGEFLFLPNTNHSFIEVGSMEKGLELKGSQEMIKYYQEHFSQALVEKCAAWMRDKEGKRF